MEDYVNGGDVAWLGAAQTGTMHQQFIAHTSNTLASDHLLTRPPFFRFHGASDARSSQVLRRLCRVARHMRTPTA